MRRDRLKERWAREDALAAVRAVLDQGDLPSGERVVASKFLAELETPSEQPIVKAASSAVV